MKRTIGTALLALLLAAPTAYAHDEVNEHGALSKLQRGLAAMATGFLELPGNIYATNRDHGGAAAATIGVAKGIGMIPVRELLGVYEVVTSPVPVPEDYEPIVKPIYPWSYFEGAPSATFSG